MDNKLLPCPFCGNIEISYLETSDTYSPVREAVVYCSKCGAKIEGRTLFEKGDDYYSPPVKTIWNTRASGWISVKDRLPEEKKNVIVWDCGDIYIAYRKRKDDSERWLNKYGDMVGVTHWMPLPEPPKEKE